MPYLSVSTWSLHRKLGPLQWTLWNEQMKDQQTSIEQQPEKVSLLHLPRCLSEKGFQAVEICHFHFPQTDEAYLKQLRESLQESGIIFHTLLIDYGDISSENSERRLADIAWLKKWIKIAHQAGAERVRVIAGEAAPDDKKGLERSISAFHELIPYAKSLGIRIVTENFKSVTSTAVNCLQIIQETNEQMGIITDFGNFFGQEKYEELAKIIPYSDSIHAKAQFNQEGKPDIAEFKQCLDLLKKTNYKGPITLIYDGPGNMWEGISRVKEIVHGYLS